MKTVKIKKVITIADSKIFKIFIKILLLLIIATFFMPFLSVSCNLANSINSINSINSENMEITLSGFDMVKGKSERSATIYQGNLTAFILIIPSAVTLILSFAPLPVIARAVSYITVSVVNALIAFGMKLLLEIDLRNKINSEFIGFLDSTLKINIKYGFVLYIAFNITLLCAGIILLITFFREAILHERDNSDIAGID